MEAADVTGVGGIDDLQNTWTDCIESKQKRDQEHGGAEGQQVIAAQKNSSPQNRVCAELNGQIVAIQLNTRSRYGVLRYLGGLLASGDTVVLAGLGAASEPRLKGALLTIQKGRHPTIASQAWTGAGIFAFRKRTPSPLNKPSASSTLCRCSRPPWRPAHHADRSYPAMTTTGGATSWPDRLFTDGPKRILSIDGGGVRGAVAAAFLQKLEQTLRDRHGRADLVRSDYFDLIGGTSVGAISPPAWRWAPRRPMR